MNAVNAANTVNPGVERADASHAAAAQADPQHPLRVLRISHSAVVAEWRQRERELRALGTEVALITSRVWNEGGVDVSLEPGGDDFVSGARTVGRHPSLFLYDPRPIWRALGERPDLIDIHEEPNALATAEVLLLRRLRGVRAPYLLYSAQNILKRYPIPFRWIERRALAGAAAVHVCNGEAGEIVTGKGLRGVARYLPLGVRLELFGPAARGLPGATRVIGYFGRLESHKGVDVLLRAVARHPEWRLDINGLGSQREALRALAQHLGVADRVRFRGFASGEELVRRYQAVDVAAVPSLPRPGWLEQFCRVAVEAMACGLPVVGSDSGAIPEVIGDAGVIVAPGDTDAWERGLAEALDPRRWPELRENALVRAAAFTWARVAREQRALYDEIRPAAAPREAPQVVVVAYGDPEPLAECLDALGGGLPVTVVDNSSLARTREVACEHGARYVDAGGNRGFAGGVNLALAELSSRGLAGRDVLLLNPDARISAAGVAAMQARLAQASDLAAVGARQTEPGSGAPVRVWWPFPTPWGAWLEAAGLGRLNLRRGFAIGSVLLLRAEALAQLGGLDERFFLYSEETDWQYRARRAGWRIEVADVAATHEGAGTGGDPRVREAHFYASAERYVRKHYGEVGWQVYRAANVVNAGIRSLLLRGERLAAARRRLAAFARGPVHLQTSMRPGASTR
ncbi:glycosyltransferase [Gryllotalpicola ginsengisoli]|uniref:glycosyltransferase n=1 Tax=Gryllotalpicola ginsengisoli TaxID=444608 RepID=UPI0003B4B49B|nr:glycosyltransferase [Gryllotalpicola ginsengisoli]